MALSPSAALQLEAGLAWADNVLYGFDIEDEESRDFLRSVIAEGQVPRGALTEIYGLTLTRGIEEWDMLLACVSSLRDRALRASAGRVQNTNLEFYIELARSGRTEEFLAALEERQRVTKGPATKRESGRSAAEKKRKAKASLKRKPPTAASRFWAEPKELDSIEVALPHSLGIEAPDTGGPVKREHNILRDLQTGQFCSGSATPKCRNDGDSAPGTSGKTRGTLRKAKHEQGPLDDDKAHVRDAPSAMDDGDKPILTQQAARSKRGTKSPFFDSPAIKGEEGLDTSSSSLPETPSKKRKRQPLRRVPPLSACRFGLIQEQLTHDPFGLLIAVTFLIKTTGRAAIPVFRSLMARYPTPEALAAADPIDIIPMIRHLGLSTVRCGAVQRYARAWVERPPCRDARFVVKNYPRRGDGLCFRAGKEFGPEDGDSDLGPAAGGDGEQQGLLHGDAVEDRKQRALGCAWEIGHLTQGAYAIDSWRIFCRDIMLGRADDWTGKGRHELGFQPEWMRVLPKDKELRACLTWMWMKEGWQWDPFTGTKEVLSDELRKAVDEGRVGYDETGSYFVSEQVLPEIADASLSTESTW